MKSITSRLEQRITIFLSHRPKTYAFIVGIGVVLFWRGIWHSADQIHAYLTYGQDYFSTDAFNSPWWDGPFSLLVGGTILYFTGAFISSFIGNELILSGLRGEKRLTEKTEGEVKNEVGAISSIKDALVGIEDKLVHLEKRMKDHPPS
ncbi:MAG TPA: hypothetical protein VJC14_01965 [Candidatus Paceibacterota bacterium]